MKIGELKELLNDIDNDIEVVIEYDGRMHSLVKVITKTFYLDADGDICDADKYSFYPKEEMKPIECIELKYW